MASTQYNYSTKGTEEIRNTKNIHKVSNGFRPMGSNANPHNANPLAQR